MTNHSARRPHPVSRLKLRPSVSVLGLLFCGLTLLAGCASSNPSEENFPAPDYSYLPPLNLNVSQVDVSNQARLDSDDLSYRSPTNPADTLALMGHQRLHATGPSGTANLAITKIEMTKAPHHALSGSYTVQLHVDDVAHNHHGFVTAHVQRTIDAPGKLGLEHNLHTLNTQLMDDMNVELEYQVRSHLSSWLTDATGTPLNATIQSQDLNGSDLPAPGAASAQPAAGAVLTGSTATANRSVNNAAGTAGTATSNWQNQTDTGMGQTAPASRIHSPPPGFLSLPQ
ncbi:hypothetical protein NQF87_06165 [Bombella sp. TMW 2.2559]|uniref:Uncharacterized protein n=1 Tax=Bombella dulcis TaxID=2967339 RepID=A0ABT3WFY9_9PROT|nr:hypothetical protein [Bombella dulcis]MCX5616558.1 hypothetical protein [Bombella dulcis]